MGELHRHSGQGRGPTFLYVHDVRVPGMLHGRVVRPPYSGLDAGEFIGLACSEFVDPGEFIVDIPGIVAVIRSKAISSGSVAEREEYAAEAAVRLDVPLEANVDSSGPEFLGDLENAIRTNPSTSRKLVDEGDVDAAPGECGQALRPHISVAVPATRLDRPFVRRGRCADRRCITVWAGTQNPYPLARRSR